MSGTYNEVQVKKLGQKRTRPAKRPTKRSRSHSLPMDSTVGAASNPGTNTISHINSHTNNTQQSSGSGGSADGASWPPLLQDFVNRSFLQSASFDPNDKAAFGEQIQSLIFSAARENKLWTNDWTKQSLPIFDPAVPLALYQDTVGAGLAASTPNQRASTPLKVAKKSVQEITNPKPANFDSNERKRQRAARFEDSSRASPTPPPSSSHSAGTPGTPSQAIVGTLNSLEKRYLRLTSEPDPAMVRPGQVLGQCISYVVNKYRTTDALYLYVNDQLKAIRQDLTVQHLKGSLARRVYEIHGRIAIENNDLGEFNQCQSQLKHLYAMKSGPGFFKKTYEFTCYRILYLLLTGNYADINLTRLEILDADSAVDETTLEPEFQTMRKCMYRALELADFVVLGNFHGFFRTYSWYKGLGVMSHAAHLLEHFMVNKQRVVSLNTMCKAFRKLPLAYVQDQLALEEGTAFYAEYGLLAYVAGSDFDCLNAKWTLQGIVDQGKFKKIDIKGQV